MKKINKNTQKIKIIMPTDDEDYQITLAAMSDPDNPPMTDADFECMERRGDFGAPWIKPGYGQVKKQTDL